MGDLCSSLFNHLRHKDVALPRVGPQLVGGSVGPDSAPTFTLLLSQLGYLFWLGSGEEGGHRGGGGHGHGRGSGDHTATTAATPTSAGILET